MVLGDLNSIEDCSLCFMYEETVYFCAGFEWPSVSHTHALLRAMVLIAQHFCLNSDFTYSIPFRSVHAGLYFGEPVLRVVVFPSYPWERCSRLSGIFGALRSIMTHLLACPTSHLVDVVSSSLSSLRHHCLYLTYLCLWPSRPWVRHESFSSSDWFLLQLCTLCLLAFALVAVPNTQAVALAVAVAVVRRWLGCKVAVGSTADD